MHCPEHLHLPIHERPPVPLPDARPADLLEVKDPDQAHTPEESKAAFAYRGFQTADVGHFRKDPSVVGYRIYGSGSNRLVLVHGLCMAGSGWFPLIERIAHSGSPYSIMVFDNRGTGVASPLNRRTKTSTMALDIVEVLVLAGWLDPAIAAAAGAIAPPATPTTTTIPPFNLAGMSMGGMISQEIATALYTVATIAAARAPAERYAASLPSSSSPQTYPLASLALIATHDGRFPNSIPPAKGVALMLRSNATACPQTRISLVVEMLYGARTLADPIERERIANYHIKKMYTYGAAPLSTFAAQTSAVQTHHVKPARWEHLRKAGVRVMCLTGDEDLLVRPSCSTLLAQATGGSEVVVPGYGHGFNLENPGLFARIMVDFLENKLTVGGAQGGADAAGVTTAVPAAAAAAAAPAPAAAPAAEAAPADDATADAVPAAAAPAADDGAADDGAADDGSGAA